MNSGWQSQPALTRSCGTLGGFHASRDELRLAKPACAHAIVVWISRLRLGFPVEGSDFTKHIGWYVPPSIIATRRLKSCFPREARPPHLADPAVDLADAVWVEIEAR